MDLELILDKHGFVVGSMEGIRYKEYETELKPGSVLFIYTHGLTEAPAVRDGIFIVWDQPVTVYPALQSSSSARSKFSSLTRI